MADGFTIKVEGLAKFQEVVRHLEFALQVTVAEVLYDHMLDVMDQAKTLCPFETGALMESGRVNRARISGGQITVDLDFGVEPPISYAVEQHENLALNHPGGKQAKFLETPLLAWASGGGPASVIDDVEDYLGRSIH